MGVEDSIQQAANASAILTINPPPPQLFAVAVNGTAPAPAVVWVRPGQSLELTSNTTTCAAGGCTTCWSLACPDGRGTIGCAAQSTLAITTGEGDGYTVNTTGAGGPFNCEFARLHTARYVSAAWCQQGVLPWHHVAHEMAAALIPLPSTCARPTLLVAGTVTVTVQDALQQVANASIVMTVNVNQLNCSRATFNLPALQSRMNSQICSAQTVRKRGAMEAHLLHVPWQREEVGRG